MIQVERRQSGEFEGRQEVWSHWRRLEHRHPWTARFCGMMVAAVIFSSAGIFVGWILSHTWRWVEWHNVTIQHTIQPDGTSELVLDLKWRLKVTCDRLRLTAPWSLVAYYPDRNVAVSLPRLPSDELLTRAEQGSGRVVISLGQRLDPDIRHELSIGLSCLQDRNGGTVHDAEIEVVVKEFVP